MHPHGLTEFSVPITLAIFLAHAASAQVTDRMKATPRPYYEPFPSRYYSYPRPPALIEGYYN
jgi:hypothetical protein